MNPIVFAIPVFMATILFEAWVAHRRAAQVYDIPDAITSLHHGVLSQVSGVFAKLLTLGIYILIFEHGRLFELPEGSIAVWVGALIAYDFFYYWAHRMGHEVNILWAAHVVHHSSEYYNLSTALRQTSTGSLLGWVFFVPLALAGVPPDVFVAVGLTNLLYQYWVHTELIGTLGWFDRVFSSPSNHRVHHGQNDYCIDKNYGGILILWDRLFGTFEEERVGPGAEPIKFGIRSPLRSFSPIWGNLHYYAEIAQKMRSTHGLLAKLGVIVAPPGGWGQPLPHFEPAGFARFDPQAPRPVRIYVAAQYALMVPFATHFLAIFPSLGTANAAAYALGIVATCVVLGMLLENRPPQRTLGIRLEQLRISALGIAFAVLPDWFGFATPEALRLLMLVSALACAAWLMRHVPATPEN